MHLLRNSSIALSSPLFIFTSRIHITIPALPVPIQSQLVFLEMLLERHMFFNLINTPLPLDALFFRSFIPPPSFHTFAAKYVNSSTSSISISLTTILSWFVFCTDLEPHSSGFFLQLCCFILNLLFGRGN